MTVFADITVSLDGFVTGPNPGVDNGLGDGGEALHRWVFAEDSPDDRRVLERATQRTGAVVLGRRLFDVVDGPHGWNDARGYGADAAPHDQPPCFVVTHQQPPRIRLTDRFHVVTAGLAAAVGRAIDAAGARDVSIMGGGSIIRQALAAGLVDELTLHVAPVLLGSGTPLFADDAPMRARFPITNVVATQYATHVTYRVAGEN